MTAEQSDVIVLERVLKLEGDRISVSFSAPQKMRFFYFSAKKMHIFSVYFIFWYKYGCKITVSTLTQLTHGGPHILQSTCTTTF